MDTLLIILSWVHGLIPFNRLSLQSNIFDYVAMTAVPIVYFVCYILVNFSHFGVNMLMSCDSICRLGNTLFTHLGCFLYVTVYVQTLVRRKNFYLKFEKSLHDIDHCIEQCEQVADDKTKLPPNNHMYYITWVLIVGIFGYALFFDIKEMLFYHQEYFFIAVMVTSYPFFAGSVVQGQFVYYVSVISERFGMLNSLFEKINKECDKKNAPVAVFDIETDAMKEFSSKHPIVITELTKGKGEEEDTDSSDDDDVYRDEIGGESNASDNHTSETNLPNLFKLHDKILSLSVLTNAEFGPQCVPYMAACFIITIFGIFLETKVIFIVGGKSRLLDYIAQIYVIWSLTTMVVAYLVLRLCCNANGHSKQSAMIVHEIMQKKPAFMLGNDLYYNKMKSFTLQFLHWEGFFQFNGIGLFALDYTFIFSTVSAATSYLIVLLQFDMSAILKSEGLL